MNKHFRLLFVCGGTVLLLVALATFLRFDAHPVGASPQWSTGKTQSSAAAVNADNPPDQNSPNANGVTGGSKGSIPTGEISYQGRLLQSGSPYNGNINITFRLYVNASVGTAWWNETQLVHVDHGLFNVMLGAVTPIDVVPFWNQVWLGIQPAGAASELSPRQLLGAAPYAMSLEPGATMYDPSSGGYLSSFWVNSDNHEAIHAVSGTQNVIVSEASGAGKSGVYSSGSGNDGHGVSANYSGTSTSCSGSITECASALYANTTGDSYGIYDHTTSRSALIIQSSANSYWDIFDVNTNGASTGGISTSGPLYVAGYATFSGGKSGYVVDIARNGGSQPLERGDVVVITGAEAAVVGNIPVALVDKANAANATGIMGVVDVLYTPCSEPKAGLQAGEQCGGFDPSITTIQPGQYLSVVTLGAYAYLKVDASAGPILAGDLLTASDSFGRAAKARQLSVQGVSFYAPGTIIGKALGNLDSGTGYIPVFVSPH